MLEGVLCYSLWAELYTKRTSEATARQSSNVNPVQRRADVTAMNGPQYARWRKTYSRTSRSRYENRCPVLSERSGGVGLICGMKRGIPSSEFAHEGVLTKCKVWPLRLVLVALWRLNEHRHFEVQIGVPREIYELCSDSSSSRSSRRVGVGRCGQTPLRSLRIAQSVFARRRDPRQPLRQPRHRLHWFRYQQAARGNP